MMSAREHCAQQVETRTLEIATLELTQRLGDASKALEMLKAQHATCDSLVGQFQRDLNAALELGREIKERLDHRAEEPSGVVATLQAAVEKTKDTVVGRVEHVRERAVAAFHRMKSDGSGEEASEQRKLDDT